MLCTPFIARFVLMRCSYFVVVTHRRSFASRRFSSPSHKTSLIIFNLPRYRTQTLSLTILIFSASWARATLHFLLFADSVTLGSLLRFTPHLFPHSLRPSRVTEPGNCPYLKVTLLPHCCFTASLGTELSMMIASPIRPS